jgi:hypothetical protein
MRVSMSPHGLETLTTPTTPTTPTTLRLTGRLYLSGATLLQQAHDLNTGLDGIIGHWWHGGNDNGGEITYHADSVSWKRSYDIMGSSESLFDVWPKPWQNCLRRDAQDAILIDQS